MTEKLVAVLDSDMSPEKQIVFVKIMIVLFGLIFFMAFLVFVAWVVGKVVDHQIDIWWKVKKQKEALVTKKINFMLMEICNSLRIPVYVMSDEWFKENRPDSAGYISYEKNAYGIKNAEIYLRDDKSYEFYGWTTFAHEIGHYISINQYKDRSEAGAEYEAGRLILKLLDSDEDKAFIKYWLDCMLDDEAKLMFPHIHYMLPKEDENAEVLNGIYTAKISLLDWAIDNAKSKLHDDKDITEEEAKIKFPRCCKDMYRITMRDYKEAGY